MACKFKTAMTQIQAIQTAKLMFSTSIPFCGYQDNQWLALWYYYFTMLAQWNVRWAQEYELDLGLFEF